MHLTSKISTQSGSDNMHDVQLNNSLSQSSCQRRRQTSDDNMTDINSHGSNNHIEYDTTDDEVNSTDDGSDVS